MFASFFLFSFFSFFGLTLLPQWSCLLLFFFFWSRATAAVVMFAFAFFFFFFFFFFSFLFFSFFYLKGLDVSITQSPWVGTTISIVIHCSHRSVIFHCSSPLPHAFFVLSSIFLASKAKQWHYMLNQSPFPHILFTLYFQFILVFGCVDYIVFMGYFVNNLGFYFVMDLLKIPDPI
jgi:hypothetical protein